MIFIDLMKAYDAMDREPCREILVGYGVGPDMIRLIMFFWDNVTLVRRASGRYGTQFKANCGVTQSGPLSPKLFIIMVDAFVREWLRQVLGDETASELARPSDTLWHSSTPTMDILHQRIQRCYRTHWTS